MQACRGRAPLCASSAQCSATRAGAPRAPRCTRSCSRARRAAVPGASRAQQISAPRRYARLHRRAARSPHARGTTCSVAAPECGGQACRVPICLTHARPTSSAAGATAHDPLAAGAAPHSCSCCAGGAAAAAGPSACPARSARVVAQAPLAHSATAPLPQAHAAHPAGCGRAGRQPEDPGGWLALSTAASQRVGANIKKTIDNESRAAF